MKYSLFFVFIFIVSCKAQNNKCKKFKTGLFKYADSDFQNSIILRNDSIQVETNSKTGNKTIGYINWLSDCKYTLTYKTAGDSINDSLVGTTFTVDIISITKNSYKYIAYDAFYEMTGEIIKVE